MNKRKTLTMFIAALMLLILPQLLVANGTAEDQPYGLRLEDQFTDLVEQVEAGELTAEEALSIIDEFREDAKVAFNADYEAIEALITAVMDGELTVDEALDSFYDLHESQRDLDQKQLREREETQEQLKEKIRDQIREGEDEFKAEDEPAREQKTNEGGEESSSDDNSGDHNQASSSNNPKGSSGR